MYWAMVALTCVMAAALALQFGGWLWQFNPRLLVILGAIALLSLGIFLTWKTPIPRLSRIRQLKFWRTK